VAKGRVSWGQPRLPSHESGDPALPSFGGSPVFMSTIHPLTQNDQIQHGNTYGEGLMLVSQPRHCICTNASRGLLVTAEFLVNSLEKK